MNKFPGNLTGLLIILFLVAGLFLMGGCTASGGVMSAANLRAALDACNEMELLVLVYQRPDHSVMDIRCIPNPKDVSETVTMRPKLPMKLIRPFYDNNPQPQAIYEQQ